MAEARAEGSLTFRRVPLLARPAVRTVEDAIKYGSLPARKAAGAALGLPLTPGDRFRWENRANFARSLRDQEAFASGRMAAIGHLWLAKVSVDGTVDNLGLASCRVVTTAGVGFLVDAMQNLVEGEAMRYHAIGTNNAAEATGNTALGGELTTQYAVANTRPTGTLGELAGNPNVFETTATITVSAGVAITEHGIFSAATSGTGVLLDRSVFSVVNLATGESLQATYDFTLPAGG